FSNTPLRQTFPTRRSSDLGDITHLSKPEEFDNVQEILKSAKVKEAFYVPGEHDVAIDEGKEYLERYGKGTKGAGWHSFDKNGVRSEEHTSELQSRSDLVCR